MWSCPKCNRFFVKENQSHSCVVYPLINHFKNKPFGEKLFNELLKKLKKIKFKIDSVPCCIHLVKSSTFCAVWIRKDNIKIDFRLDREVKSDRFLKVVKMSSSRFLYYLDVKDKKEIDKELLSWINESYELMN